MTTFTVAKLIEFLQTCPPEAEVRVLKEVSAGYQTWTTFTEVELERVGEYTYSDQIELCGETLYIGEH